MPPGHNDPSHPKLLPTGLQVTKPARPFWKALLSFICPYRSWLPSNRFREAVPPQSFQQILCFNIHLCSCRTVWPGLSHGANNNTNCNSRQKKIEVNFPDSCGNTEHVCWNSIQEFNDIVDSSISLYST